MKILKKGIALILAAILGVGMCACGSQTNDIEALTNKFENSCNKLELNDMLDCIDPEVSGSIKKITGLIGMFSDKDTDQLIEGFAKVLFNELPENSKEFFSSIKIKVDNIEMDGDSAVASAEISYDISGEINTADANLEYTNIDGKWYISDLGLN